MYQVDSDRHRGLELVLPESKVVALPLQQEAPECVGDALVEVNTEKNVTNLSSDRELEQFISKLLKYGVLLASTVVLMGGIVYLMRYGGEPVDYRFFQGEPSLLCSPKGVVTAVLSGHCRAVIQLGLLLLVATPVARVIFSLLTFLRKRDFTYVILTVLVLSGLIYSFIGAYA